MICGTFTVRKVPADKADLRVELFKATDPAPLEVTKTPDGDGTFTVTAVFPKCPDDTTHDPEGASED